MKAQVFTDGNELTGPADSATQNMKFAINISNSSFTVNFKGRVKKGYIESICLPFFIN